VTFKKFGDGLVFRAEDMVRVPEDDPEYLEWLEAGNSPFPPDPPSPEDVEAMK
jgi:hypothetical protein